MIFWITVHTRVQDEKAESEASAKWKEVKEELEKINELILKTKGDLKEVPDNI